MRLNLYSADQVALARRQRRKILISNQAAATCLPRTVEA